MRNTCCYARPTCLPASVAAWELAAAAPGSCPASSSPGSPAVSGSNPSSTAQWAAAGRTTWGGSLVRCGVTPRARIAGSRYRAWRAEARKVRGLGSTRWGAIRRGVVGPAARCGKKWALAGSKILVCLVKGTRIWQVAGTLCRYVVPQACTSALPSRATSGQTLKWRPGIPMIRPDHAADFAPLWLGLALGLSRTSSELAFQLPSYTAFERQSPRSYSPGVPLPPLYGTPKPDGMGTTATPIRDGTSTQHKTQWHCVPAPYGIIPTCPTTRSHVYKLWYSLDGHRKAT